MSGRNKGKKPTNKNIIEPLDDDNDDINQIDKIFTELKAINSKLSNLTIIEEQITDLKDELKLVIESQKFINKQYEDQKNEISRIKEINGQIYNENKSLKLIINKLEQSLNEQIDGLNSLEQYGRKQMVDIVGIPRFDIEDTDKIVLAISEKFNMDLCLDDIEISHRVSNHDKAPIILKFKSRRKRDQFLSEGKQSKFTTEDLGYQEGNSENRIYINENLTKMNKDIFIETKIKLKGLIQVDFSRTNPDNFFFE